MLQQMCHQVLAKVDLKAIAKSRGFPTSASNPGIMAGLFLTDQGLVDAMKSLDKKEFGLLHLLKAVGKPVTISFFERIYPARRGYGTATQKYQGVLTKVKDRLVRSGILLMYEQYSLANAAKMELWRFVLPSQFQPHLPPLLQSLLAYDGPADRQPDAVREKLLEDLGSAKSEKGSDPLRRGQKCNKIDSPPKGQTPFRIPSFQLAEGELRLGESRFKTGDLAKLKSGLWIKRLGGKKKTADAEAGKLDPTEAVYQLLAGLGPNQWTEAEPLDEFAKVFAAEAVDCQAVCHAGWECGVLVRHQAGGRTWYRLASDEVFPLPSEYLKEDGREKCVAIDLSCVPFTVLDLVLGFCNARQHPTKNGTLLLTPNLVRMGRANSDAFVSDEVQWLVQHSPVFAQAREILANRRGKTLLHDNLLIARVTDLSLKVALEKGLGEKWVSLKNDYVAFPRGAWSDVQRIVKKLGHVIKEVVGDES